MFYSLLGREERKSLLVRQELKVQASQKQYQNAKNHAVNGSRMSVSH